MISLLAYLTKASACLLAAAILAYGFSDNLAVVDTAVVLGNTVYPDGTLSPRLKARLDRALELYRQGYFKRIIVSGASGAEGYDEADAMKNYLIAQGIAPTAIVADPHGYNTFETARNTAALMVGRQDSSVMAISQYFHLLRCTIALRKFGLKNVRAAHAHYFGWRDVYSLFREVAAIPVYLLRKNT